MVVASWLESRSHASWTTSSASACDPSIRYATARNRSRWASNASVSGLVSGMVLPSSALFRHGYDASGKAKVTDGGTGLMEARVKDSKNPDVISAIQQLTKTVYDSGVDPKLMGLVHLRASQINGCSPCVYAGVRSAKKQGESDERLHNVVAWRETALFTDAERAVPELTEAATRIQDGAVGVTDD